MPLARGDKLGPYEILELIGKGGMGEVYKAHDPRVGREVAIKISTMQFSERFEREARVIARLNHPNICTLFDVRYQLAADWFKRPPTPLPEKPVRTVKRKGGVSRNSRKPLHHC